MRMMRRRWRRWRREEERNETNVQYARNTKCVVQMKCVVFIFFCLCGCTEMHLFHPRTVTCAELMFELFLSLKMRWRAFLVSIFDWIKFIFGNTFTTFPAIIFDLLSILWKDIPTFDLSWFESKWLLNYFEALNLFLLN